MWHFETYIQNSHVTVHILNLTKQENVFLEKKNNL